MICLDINTHVLSGSAELCLELASTDASAADALNGHDVSALGLQADSSVNAQGASSNCEDELEKMTRALSGRQRHLYSLMKSMQEVSRSFLSSEVKRPLITLVAIITLITVSFFPHR